MLTMENLLVVLLLLPGFLAARVFGLVAVRRRRSTLEAWSEIVLFEFLVLTAYGACSVAWIWPRLDLPPDHEAQSRAIDALRGNVPALSMLVALSVAMGVGLGWLHNLDQPLAFLRRFGVTKQSTHATVWQAAFSSQTRWVIVHLDSGKRVLGWPSQFSDTPDEGSLFLSRASYLDSEERLTRIRGPGILITKEAGIRMVEFLDGRRTGARRKQ